MPAVQRNGKSGGLRERLTQSKNQQGNGITSPATLDRAASNVSRQVKPPFTIFYIPAQFNVGS